MKKSVSFITLTEMLPPTSPTSEARSDWGGGGAPLKRSEMRLSESGDLRIESAMASDMLRLRMICIWLFLADSTSNQNTPGKSSARDMLLLKSYRKVAEDLNTGLVLMVMKMLRITDRTTKVRMIHFPWRIIHRYSPIRRDSQSSLGGPFSVPPSAIPGSPSLLSCIRCRGLPSTSPSGRPGRRQLSRG